MPFDLSYPGALLAGLLSFVSPCVLPLVPPYLCFLGGVSLEQLSGEDRRDRAAASRVAAAALAFVLGFTTVFVIMGATAAALSQLLVDNLRWLAMIAGAVIIVFGLHMMGVFRIGLLFREARFHPEARPAGLFGAYLVGLAFAFGWTPCVGPVLAAILTVAAAREELWQGVALLAAYSLGIGLPFLLAALFAGPFIGLMKRARRYLRAVELAMGALLVATGALILSGSFSVIGIWMLETFPVLGRVG